MAENRDARCECDVPDNHRNTEGRCQRLGDGAEQMTDGRVHISPALCLPCLFGCSE